MTQHHHKINYVELCTTDFPATEAFYSKAFGWSFQNWGQYYSFSGAGIDGGFAEGIPVAGDGVPLIILYSDNLEKTVKAIEEAGGEIIVPIFAFPGGKRFHFRDPTGNVLAVWGDPVHAEPEA